jgi:hypothetical protein
MDDLGSAARARLAYMPRPLAQFQALSRSG